MEFSNGAIHNVGVILYVDIIVPAPKHHLAFTFRNSKQKL